MAREKANVIRSGAAGEGVRGFPPRWLLLGLVMVAVCGVIAAVAGSKTGAVFGTFIYAVFLVPVVGCAGTLGLALTEPLARRGIFEGSPWPAGFRMVMAVGLGLGAFSLGTLLLGTVHLVEPGGIAWPLMVLPVGGLCAGFTATRRFFGGVERGLLSARAHRGEWLLILAAVPVAVLLIAATFPPGSIWASEANGYDVTEYHLELPREYALNNSTAPLGHNVYSYLPGNVEMLYLLVQQFAKGVMGGERDFGYVWGAYPAQFCHVLLTLLTAAAVGLAPVGVRRRKDKDEDKDEDEGWVKEGNWLGATGRVMAVLLFLGVPWTLITGSLAYNEMGMMLFGTLALGLALERGVREESAGGKMGGTPMARAALIGVLLGLAVGCKMTAGVFFALPVAAIYLVRAATDGGQLKYLLVAAGLATAVYVPWAVRAAAYSGGNPVFPLASSILPRDGWTAVETERFDRGHGAPAALRGTTARVWALGENSVLDGQWSVQPYPTYLALTGSEAEAGDMGAWKRVGLLWLAVPLALAGAFLTRAGRGEAGLLALALGVQVVAWLWGTHLESRFLLPAAVPLALLAGRGVQGLYGRREAMAVAGLRIVAGTVIALHACVVVLVLLPESGLLAGPLLRRGAGSEMRIGQVGDPPWNLAATIENPAGTLNVPAKKILLIGEARAWMYIGEVEYATVFDRSAFFQTLGDPTRALAWLRAEHVAYVLVNWEEVERLRRTYGFDAAVTRESIGGLERAGVVDTHVEAGAGLEILRVPG